nr:LOW QUALITY PROTEIN: adhesion G-protein coupled receptor V1 [Ictidomys tridecemlineatus]
MLVSSGQGMPSASSLVNLLSALFISFVFGETEIRFAGQTEFVVNETSTTVIRLVIERIGEPANVTAIVSLYGEDTGDFFDTYAAAFIPAGETNRTVYIAVCDDDLPEPDETFIFHLTLQKPLSNVKLGWPRTVTVTILSNDNAFGIISFNMPSSITVSEPRGRNESVPFILIREKGTYGMVTVTFEVEGGPNPPEEDLSPVRGNITFPPGRATVIYNLTVLDDEVPENDEIFFIYMTSLEGGAEINTSRNSVEIIIKKNDAPVRFIQSVYLVPEEDHVLIIPVVCGKDNNGNLIGSDEYEVSIRYTIKTGNSTAHAQQNLDFIDLQPNTTIVFPPLIHEFHLKFQIVDDTIPEIAESFHIMLLKDTLQGDAVLVGPSIVQVTIKPNDKPYGVLSFNSILFERPVIIDEDTASRFEEITVVRNGGTHGNVSVNWVLTRNSSDPSPVTADIRPSSGVLHFSQGQMLASIPFTIVNDDLPEEAEAFLLKILPHTVQGGAEVSEPAELLFYIQDSDDVYGLITFFPMENQKIESSPGERHLSLSFTRLGGTKGDVRMLYSARYIPAAVVDPLQVKNGILNTSRKNSLIFPEHKTQVTTQLPIRNDAFLQNGAHFIVQLESVMLVNIKPPIPPISPRFGEIRNISLLVTPAIANGEIGFISNFPIILHEPEDSAAEVIFIPLHRDGTDGQATVYWSLKPSGFNSEAVTMDDIGPFNGSVVFLSGQSDTTINITVKGDDIPEMNETVTLSLDRVNVENQVLKSGYTTRDLVILENDDPGGVFEFSPASRGPYVIKEGDSVELHIIRSRGALVKQFLHYRVEPRDSSEFYGNTGVLEFKPGEREIVITLLSRLDGIPELDEHYWVVLSSHGERESKLGSASVVNITILKNDDPHGIIEFVSDGLIETINESKADNIYSAVYGVIRHRGNFGDVSVSWVVSPDFTQDVIPVQGTIFFGDKEFSKNITLYSLPDEIPEEMEEFTIILLNATGGAKVGNKTTATLRIRRNDDPIYFAEPRLVRVQEGETANFTVLRNGSADVICTVQYATVDGKATAKEGDFVPAEKEETLIFEVGSREQSLSVYVNEDGIPETDEAFYIILFNSTGDTVVYQYGIATVIIEANDDPNGIFSLEPIDKAVEEGKTNAFWILRHQGHFGNVTVAWQLFQNDSVLQHGQEFYETSGTVNFMDGEGAKPIILHAFPDKIPEFNEFYILKLINITGGSPGPGGQFAETNLQVTVMIPFNDDPFGIFILDSECLEREVAEDVLSEDDMSYITNFTILRQQGVFGDVRVGWEIVSSEFTSGLPPMIDFLLVGIFPSSVHLQPHMRRHHTGTDALYFSGLEGAFGTVNAKYHPSRNNTIANFTFSAWVMPNANTNGFVIAKDNGNGSIYYGVKIQTNESHVTFSLHYKTLGSNATYIAKTTVKKYLEEGVWLHLIIILDDGIIEFYLDGNAMPRGIKSLKGEAISDGPGILRIGAGMNGNDRFTGLMQDVRSYERKLTLEEIYELHAMPSKNDLHPISGYVEFRQGETNKSFIVSARDDNEEEGEELFILKLVSVYGGAHISEENTTARLIIQKSDNANGLFGFTGACIPEIAEEGSTISCVVERTRGALDYVHVFYTISQIESNGINYLVDDFANASGTITFLPWQRSEVLNIYVLDDDIPELTEYFRVTLVSAIPGDGKLGSTPTSGASIDPEKETTDITVKASDHPFGLLQFSTGLPPQPEDPMSLPASSVPNITVQEEDGEVRLLVVRAQGLLGRVTAEYRTVSLTAFSPEDYQNVAGTLEFQPEERYKYIFVNITNNSIPELEKSFKVELLNLEGGVTELFRVDGSGSGDGDMEFFIPTIHKRASLGVASQILVTIAASDHAHGVFEFSPESLFVNGTEPEDGHSTVMLNFQSILESLRFSSLLVPNSPRLGPKVETVAHLIILANDNAFGTLQLSAPVVRVTENHVGPIINVTRTGGAFADVSVKFKAVPITAVAGEDYSIASSDVVLLEGETSKAVPIYIINDIYPELEESFLVQLLNQTTGGAKLGTLTEAVIIIEASDDPYGLFGFQITKLIVEEPEFNSVKVNLPIIRNSGTLGNVTIEWVATINGQLATGDLRVVSGNVTFAPGETIQTLLLEVLADDVPEIEEVIQVQLTDASGGGTIGLDPVANIIIPANDNPYGTVAFVQSVYRVQEPLERSSCANITVRRSGGHFGQLLLFYSTSDIDVVALAVEEGEDLLSYYESPIQGVPDPLWRTWVNVSAAGEPQHTCATLCLKEHACLAFSFFSASEGPQCFWMTSSINPSVNHSDFWTYRKNMTRVASLFSGQAVAGSDYEPVTRQWAIMLEGDEIANLTVSILPDDFPEMDESFLISLLEVHLMNITATFENQPTIGQPNTSTVTIALNGDAFGVFVIYSISPNTSEDGLFVEVQEQPQTSVELVIHRTGGSLGQVTVEWRVVGGTATEGLDFIGAGDILTFAEGETKKTAILTILDDSDPEDDESIIVSLVYTEGGSRILPSSDTVRVNILANDNVAGIVSFQTASRSVIGHEGGFLFLSTFIFFSMGTMNQTILVHLLDDNIPEEKEVYQVILYDVRTQGVQKTQLIHYRLKDSEGLTAQIIIDANDGARGMIQWQHSRFEVNETHESVILVVHRSGEAPGHVSLFVYAQNLEAQLGLDYIFTPVILHFSDGERHKNIEIMILDDDIPEGDEKFQLILTNPSPGLDLGQQTIGFCSSKLQGGLLKMASMSGLPLSKLYSFSAFHNFRATSIDIEETNRTVYLNVSRTNGIDLAVSVQWETISQTAFGMSMFSFFSQVRYFTSDSQDYLIVASQREDSELTQASDMQHDCNAGQQQGVQLPVGPIITVQTAEIAFFHILVLGQEGSALYCWNSELNQFSFVLEAPSAQDAYSVTVKSLNSSKNLIAVVGAAQSHMYELAYISSQSDFIPSSGELIFEPGDREATIAVNILDDVVPEEEESFKVQLKNPKGGAEIGSNGYVKITILSNDDAYGVVGFAQNSLFKQIEEMEQDSLVTLNVERLKGTYGRITVAWEADGSIDDIFPTSGVISFTEGQALSTITLTVLADDIPELSEVVTITLTRIATEGVEDPSKGATIDQKRNKSVITTLPSDSPYGLVGWHAKSLFTRVAEPKVLATREIEAGKFLGPRSSRLDDAPELEEGFIIIITEVNLVNSDFSAEQPSVQRPGMETAEITTEENDDPRGIFIFHVTRDVGGVITAHEVPPPLNVLQVPVVRLAGSFETVNVYWKAIPGTAGLEDFNPSQGILEFADGQVTAVIQITIIDDAEVELMEMFNISLIHVAGGGRLGDDVVVTVIIPQNDSPLGVFGFEKQTIMVNDSLLSDENSYVTLTVVRSPGGKGAVRLRWTVDEKAKDNLSPLSGTLHFDEMESQKTIVLHALQDTMLEKDRHYTIQLLPIDEVEISPAKGSASIIILGERGAPGEVGIAPSSRHVLIGEPSAKYNGTAIISLVRGPAIWGEVTVFWRIIPPSVGVFAQTSGKLTMRDGQSAAIVVIQALNDNIPEEKSFYEFQLTEVSEGGVLSDSRSTANITVVASDFPYGRFSFSQEQLRVSEEALGVNVTVIRSGGYFGLVRLWYKTVSGTADAGSDFVSASGELLFEARETVKSLLVEILDDDHPEGPEEFSIAILKVELQGRGYDFTIQENGLQIDQPPEIGNTSVVRIIIMKNDNAEGIIEFDPKYTTFKVEEDVRAIAIPVVRLHGTYGIVTADVISQSSSAVPGGVSYMLHSSSVTFQHGQNLSFINVSITDGSESEFEEPFEILLTGATGGAILGRHLVSRITITKSESPFSTIRFLNQSKISVPNPNSTMILSLVLERTGRLLGEIQVNWEIVGPNSQETLPPQNRDIADPVSGSFFFGDGEDGVRTIILAIYPHEEIEVEKTFVIKLKLVKGDANLDSRAKDITLTIQKFGDPNGVVHFAPESLSKKTYVEPPDLEGPLVITFFVRRVKGTFGEITIYWELSSEFDITGDFISTNGFFTMADGETDASFDVHLLPDDIPEIEEDCVMQLVSVEGGAELDVEKCITWFSVSASDDPHGVFALYPDHQSILIGQDLIRSVQINITRLAGTFGDVAVRFRISSDHKEQLVATKNAEMQLVVQDGARYKVDMVPIKNQVFLSLGSNITLQLVTVMLLSGNVYGMPTILQEAKSAVLPVPEEAANSQVGFESTAFQLTDITAGTSQVMISRTGTYGALSVTWTTGYAPGLEIPESITVGNMTPILGSLSFSHGEQRKGVLLWTFPSPGRLEAFVIHLSGVRSSAPGGAQLRSGFTIAEIEPMGVFQFSPSSRSITVSEDIQIIRLHVQRLFGFHSDLIKVSYETTPGSAKPLEDFEPIQKGEMFFQKFQAEVDFEITIINDQLHEMEETFYVNLTSVEIQGLQKFDANWRPRLNLDFSVAVITILDNDDVAGMDVSVPLTAVAVVVDTTLIPIETDSTTYPGTSELTTIPQTTEMAAIITETTGLSATPENLVTVHGSSTMPEKPDMTTVTASISIHGTFSLGPPIVYVEEEMKNGTFNTVEIHIQRTGGFEGNVSVTVKTFGKRCAQKEPNALPFQDIYETSNWTWAVEEEDFEEQSLILMFLDGERERKVSVPILDDDEPEGQEFFFVFLTDPQGGAQIVKGKDATGFAAFAMVVIAGSDLHNGFIGFSEDSQDGLELGEGADMRRLHLLVTRQPNRAFEDVQVSWRVTLNKTAIVLQKEGVNLMDELLSVSGNTTCTAGQTQCFISLELKPGKIPQVEVYFFVELYEVTSGAAINNSARFAQIKVLQSDEPLSLVYFSVGSRLAVAEKKATLISLQVERDSGTGLMISVNFSTQVSLQPVVTCIKLSAVVHLIEKITVEGKNQVFSIKSRTLFYEILCALVNPKRKDTRGFIHFTEVTEDFAFSLLTNVTCGSPGEKSKTILDSCPYLSILALHWYPQQINGHKFEGKEGDYIRIPEKLLDVSDAQIMAGKNSCKLVQFTEYSSQQWFITGNNLPALKNKVLSLRIVTIVFCSSWLSDSQFCKVVEDTADYVECACSHMSLYAAYAQTDNLSSYNEAFFSSGFICISGLCLAVLSHIFCARYSMFAAKLLTHMMAASLGTQIVFLVSAYVSPQLTEDSCSAMAAITHYLYLCQFSWMLIQSVNFWYVLVMNDEHTERRYLLFFLLSWGLPSFVVILLIVILKGVYHQSMAQIYGLIHGDLCFIPNIYAALFTAALVPLMCLVVVFVVFIHAYQVKPQWKAYDDVFRGRTNAAEIPLILYLFALISMAWLWGGLHMAYRQFWMLVLFVIFNSLQGLYVFVVYFILHNQMCCPMKASYTVEMNGHPGPSTAFFTPGSGMPPAGGEISKSTQNLISAMEEVPPDWERASFQQASQASPDLKTSPQNGATFPTAGYGQGSLIADEESQEFDDLIFALKTGAGLSISDNESGQGSQEGGTLTDSQIVELRRIPIADTHL